MKTIFISLALNICLLAVFYILFQRKFSPELKQRKVVEELKRDINNIIVEMNSTADRNIDIIENRIETLKELIEKADKRITLLKKDSRLDNEAIKIQVSDKPINSIKIPKKLSFKEQVLDLYGKGIEAKLIAAKLEANIGEVELIISLSGRKN